MNIFVIVIALLCPIFAYMLGRTEGFKEGIRYQKQRTPKPKDEPNT